jgi:hypothetical protein
MRAETKRKINRLIARAHRHGLRWIRPNAKTIVSLDVDNICPKAAAGDMCAYCYRKDMERAKRLRLQCYAPAELDSEKVGTLRQFCRDLRMLVPCDFSIRTFSLSDCREEHLPFWQSVWGVIRAEGLRVHVITKQFHLVPRMVRHVDNVQLSIDSLEPRRHGAAIRLRDRYDNVFLRCVTLNAEDRDIRNGVDIVTVYHGWRVPGLETFRTTALTHRRLCRKVERETGIATCCATGQCDTCQKCWKLTKE